MSLDPLLNAGLLVASHAVAAVAALLLGIVQLAAPKGTLPHRTLGYIWCALMFWIAGSSFFIHDIRLWGPFSPIHLLSLLVLFGIVSAIFEARRRDVKAHRRSMILLFTGALVIAGAFTLSPGRVMHEVLFGA